MKHRLLMGVCMVWIGFSFGMSHKAQHIQAAQMVTPTSVDSDNLRVFPSDLICDRREETLNSEGSSWMGITIGQSILEDVERLLATFSDDYVFIDNNDYDPRFLIFENSSQRESDIPSSVHLCLEGSVVQALAVGYHNGLLSPRLNLSDLVAQYGEPDAITWTDNPASRVAFWFERGIAVDVTVLPNVSNNPRLQPTFGRVEVEIYFPYQEVDGYESRWPYNQTRQLNQFLPWPYEGQDDYGPENPFDFELIIATITAQPSLTPTPTFISQTAIPNVTATP